MSFTEVLTELIVPFIYNTAVSKLIIPEEPDAESEP